MNTTRRNLTLVSACLFGLIAGAPESLAGTVYVASHGDGSCSLANAQAAYLAASPGDTVVFPAGNCTWSSAVTVSKPITFVGAGANSGGTTLVASGTMPKGFFFVTNVASSTLMRISGFRFVMSGRTQAFGILIQNSVSLTALRIDHNRFDAGKTHIEVGGCKGVIDHNEFYNGDIDISFTAGSRQQADDSWASMSAGTGDALFVEDNSFVDDANYPVSYQNEKIGTYNGGKLVVRYNTFDFDAIPLSTNNYPFMAHGSAAGGVANGYWQTGTGARRGQSVIEFYNNTMQGPRIDFLYISRGSANLVHHNAITGTVANAPRVYFYEEEQYEAQWSPSRTAWPAEDQVHNSFIWANTYKSGAYFDQASHVAIGDSSAAFIQANRDYFLHEPQASGGSESFTGANGASSTYPTNGTVHPTLGTMVFTPTGPNAYYGYVPYTYPHPLTAPAAPTNVQIKK
jgi:hypothetical protein